MNINMAVYQKFLGHLQAAETADKTAGDQNGEFNHMAIISREVADAVKRKSPTELQPFVDFTIMIHEAGRSIWRQGVGTKESLALLCAAATGE